MPAQTPLFSPPHLSYTHTSLAHTPPQRPDSRPPLSFRALRAETGLLPATYGSARVCGPDGTEVVVGVRGEVVPCADAHAHAGDEKWEKGSEEEQSWVEVAVQMPEDAATGGGGGGGGGGAATATAAGMENVLRESLASDASLGARLRLGPRWRWKIFIDVPPLTPFSLPLSHSHPPLNPRQILVVFPSPLLLLSLTTHLALRNTRLPCLISGALDDPVFADDWAAADLLYEADGDDDARPPVTLLVVAVGANVFVDPAPEELAVADAAVAVSFRRARGHANRVQLLAVRTVETEAAGGARVGEAEEGAWRRRRGGVGRAVLKRLVAVVVREGGVGEDVLTGLETWL